MKNEGKKIKVLSDVQKTLDRRGIRIQKVGVREVHLPLQILTKEGSYQHVLGNVSLGADLTDKYRGTHLSRFMEILNRWSKKPMSSKEIFKILNETKEKLQTERAELSIHFKYFIGKNAPITGAAGYLDYDCRFYGVLQGDIFSFVLGADVPVQTVCPCSKEISDYGAHNQRALVKIKLEYYPGEFIWLEDLISQVESAGSSGVYPVLKREDEKFITESSFDNPKFVEDVLRDLVEKFRSDERIRWFEVECDSIESIHNHNAFAYQKEYRPLKENKFQLIPIPELYFMFY